METPLLLAWPTPLPRERDLPSVLGKLGPQSMEGPQAMAWFVNGRLQRDDPNRAPNLKSTSAASNPVVRTQAQLWERLKGDFPYVTAVSFANQGG